MTIAAVYIFTFLPNSIFNLVVHTGGVRLKIELGPVNFLRLQVGFFALNVSCAFLDPLLTLYWLHDYRDALVKKFKQVGPTFSRRWPQTTEC